MVKVIEKKKIKRRIINSELAYYLLKKANNYGIKCPRIYRINNKNINYSKEGNPIIITEYMLNTFLKDYSNITEKDIYDVGREVAKLKLCFKQIDKIKKIDYENFISKIKQEYYFRLKNARKSKNKKFNKDVIKQKRIIKMLNIKSIKKENINYCHRDLSSDNILFDKNGFNSLVDFEIAGVSFDEVDIARVFLTYCLDNNGYVNKKLLKSLLDGYNSLNCFTINDLIYGIKMLWYLEVELWIKEKYYTGVNTDKVKKFIYEINWIMNNWDNLYNILKYNI